MGAVPRILVLCAALGALAGAPAVAAHVAERFGLEHSFIEIENPA